jgi:hypothetical protein
VHRRWGVVIGLVVAGIAVIPLANAGAQAPPTTADQTIEGSAPPGGTVNCATAPTLTPDHGPPGTEVTATAEFIGNCDDVLTFFLEDMTCEGTVTGGGVELSFPVTVTIGETTVSVSGTFTAPPTEPDPPVVDAVEDLAVTITCFVPAGQPTSTQGAPVGTTYVYPPANYGLELFADPDTEQPTLVEDDEVVDPTDPGVVSGSPTFTG